MYDELVKTLRNWIRVCVQHDGSVDQLHDDAADAIEELRTQNEKWEEVVKTALDFIPCWIPVTERLPEHAYGESTSVLTVDIYGVMRVAYFDGGNWCWPSGDALTTMRVAPITHWMPLPEPPEEET